MHVRLFGDCSVNELIFLAKMGYLYEFFEFYD